MFFENNLFWIGVVFMICGMFMYYFPPKKINSLYGYRTANAMKSQKRWDFAQKYSVKYMFFLGFIYVVITTLFSFTALGESQAVILGLGLLILMVILLFIIVEIKIKKKFK